MADFLPVKKNNMSIYVGYNDNAVVPLEKGVKRPYQYVMILLLTTTDLCLLLI